MASFAAKYFILLRDSKYVFLINIADKLFSFIIFLLLAREFSRENYGAIVTLFTLASVLVTIFDFGLPVFLQREIAVFNSRATELFSKVFTIGMLLLPVYFLLLYALSWLLYPNLQFSLVVIIGVTLYESSLINICNKSLSGLNDFKNQFSALWISRLYAVIFFIAALYFLHFTLDSLMAIVLIGFFLNLVLLFQYIYKNNINFSFSHFNFLEAKGILKISIPLGMAIVFNFMYDKIDVLLLSKLKDFSEAAYYNIAYGLFKSAMLSFSFLLAMGFTRVAAISRNKRAVLLFFKKYFFIIFIISIATGIIMFGLSGYIIKWVYTEKFNPSIPVLQILSVALVGNALNNLTGIILNGIGLFKAVMYITLFGLIVNICLNLLFIPHYGAMAAGVITVVTEYFIFFFEIYYVLKILKAK